MTAPSPDIYQQMRSLGKYGVAALLVWLTIAGTGFAESYRDKQQRRPDLFDPVTGYRIAWQRGATPHDIPGPAQWIDTAQATELLAKGALAIDVFGALQSRYDELEGTWLVAGPRDSLPGAVWLPETGRGSLTADIQAYLESNLTRLSGGDLSREIVVFCVADCWMSWNAAQRIAGLGYTQVFWYRLGTDGWRESGRALMPVLPTPVTIE